MLRNRIAGLCGPTVLIAFLGLMHCPPTGIAQTWITTETARTRIRSSMTSSPIRTSFGLARTFTCRSRRTAKSALASRLWIMGPKGQGLSPTDQKAFDRLEGNQPGWPHYAVPNDAAAPRLY